MLPIKLVIKVEYLMFLNNYKNEIKNDASIDCSNFVFIRMLTDLLKSARIPAEI